MSTSLVKGVQKLIFVWMTMNSNSTLTRMTRLDFDIFIWQVDLSTGIGFYHCLHQIKQNNLWKNHASKQLPNDFDFSCSHVDMRRKFSTYCCTSWANSKVLGPFLVPFCTDLRAAGGTSVYLKVTRRGFLLRRQPRWSSVWRWLVTSDQQKSKELPSSGWLCLIWIAWSLWKIEDDVLTLDGVYYEK